MPDCASTCAEIKKLHGDLKATSIYVTHDQIEAMTLADRIVAMHAGIVQQVGTPLDLYDRPANLFVAGFIGSPGMNFIEGTYSVSGNRTGISLADGTMIPVEKQTELTRGAKVTLGIRPEHVAIVQTNGIEAAVELIEPTGFGIILHLSLRGTPFKIFTLDRGLLDTGPKLKVSFPLKHVHLFDETGSRLEQSTAGGLLGPQRDFA